MNNTRFSRRRFNEMIQEQNSPGRLAPMPEVNSMDDFQEKYPVTGKDDLRKISHEFISAGHFKGSYIIATSGTTSDPLVLGHRTWEEVTEDTYAYQFFVYLMTHVFNEDDVVANLFTPGGLGVLYEGACRFLEPIGATILPIGILGSIDNGFSYIGLFKELGLNTIMGAPSSVVQFAQSAKEQQVDLDIRKIVYTGEHFYPAKKEIVKTLWPKASFYSLFGGVEYGFAAINTPSMADGVHEILEDWYFVEIDKDDNILLTDLTSPLIPIIRYKIGDKGKLTPAQRRGGGAGLTINGRSDACFNICGNSVAYETIRQALEADIENSDSMQIILTTDATGVDLITVALNIDLAANPEVTGNAWQAIKSINEIAEGIDHGKVKLKIAGRESQKRNWRTKTMNILDFRVNLNEVGLEHFND